MSRARKRGAEIKHGVKLEDQAQAIIGLLNLLQERSGGIEGKALPLTSYATADLPDAASRAGALVYDDTVARPKFSNGTTWTGLLSNLDATAAILTFLATPSSANLAAALTDEAGTGVAYFTGGALGTPASGTLTNCTGLPISTGVSGLASGVATFLATPSSANLAAALTDETGSGAAVFATSPTITTPNIVGSSTNDAAAAGSVGQTISATLSSGSATSLTSTTAKTITSISLTAGDWDVAGTVYFLPANTTTMTALIASISQTNNTLDSTPGAFAALTSSGTIITGNGLTASSQHISQYRISLSATTTIYLVAQANFGASTCTAYGNITARRRR